MTTAPSLGDALSEISTALSALSNFTIERSQHDDDLFDQLIGICERQNDLIGEIASRLVVLEGRSA